MSWIVSLFGVAEASATRPTKLCRKPGSRRGGKTGPPSDGVLRIATNLVDVPAEIVAEIYRQRWTIELFFRFFKHILGCRHLLSTSRRGVEIQAYCAIIACLLLALSRRRQADLADLRDGLPLLAGLGRPGGTARAFEKAQAQRCLGPLLFSSDGPSTLRAKRSPLGSASLFRPPTSPINQSKSDTMRYEQSLSRTGMARSTLFQSVEMFPITSILTSNETCLMSRPLPQSELPTWGRFRCPRA